MPQLKPSELASHGPKDYVIRFCFGAAISLVAGLIGMKFGPRLGGVFLGFPAILPASLTLIQQKSGREEAAIDSLGAVLGAVAMVIFAAGVLLAVSTLGVVPVLALALVLWLAVAVALYAVVRFFYPLREPTPP